ncbi:hypothetical protein IW261DRAFT_1446820 [Armillaria novae-zelandiae]|uniref:Uncharacterized protein n=1 Tax=Armillaria novae-zelandiae TaxID=153914 RepID=A0AA39PNT6_9AGAR|nr:hypothetical protein IW261DRAFT_1446820 [Armillaria novae-zelandiae]
MENISPSLYSTTPRLDLRRLAASSHDDAARMLISPPPEEELRVNRVCAPALSAIVGFTERSLQNTPRSGSQTKRKRQMKQPQQSTPNPKPRKQLRSRTPSPSRTRSPYKTVLLQSPHANNPNADYIIPTAYSRRRSTTPVTVPYEPPADVFSPPREVIVSAVVRTPRRRTKLAVTVKKEPPVIDLSEPMPPPSPTDDPLLLTGPPNDVLPKRPTAKPRWSLPPSSPQQPTSSPPNEAPSYFRFEPPPDTSLDMDVDEPFNNILFGDNFAGDGWSDSDDDVEMQGQGDYTGKWKMKVVKTKNDPPSSATRTRMEDWGRPISPYPCTRRRVSCVIEEDDDNEAEEPVILQQQFNAPGDPLPSIDDDNEAAEENQLPAISVGVDKEGQDPDDSQENASRAMRINQEDQDAQEEREVREMSIGPGEDELSAQSSTIEPPDNDAEEEKQVREMSIEKDVPVSPRPMLLDPIVEPVAVTGHFSIEQHEAAVAEMSAHSSPVVDAGVQVTEAMDESDSSDEEIDMGVVKITSSDPRAAARAAAILKQHDYECYTKAKFVVKERDRKRRRRTMDGGISKSSPVRLGGAFVTPAKGRRRETLGGVIGDRVYLPGSPVMTLEGLLQEAEVQVMSARKPVSGKESIEKSSAAMKLSNVWTKDEWKLLDMCFTEERYVAGGGNIMAEVDDVDIDAVVWRFLELAPDSRWDEHELEHRSRAIAKKQRSGKAAPPFTPRASPVEWESSVTASPLERWGRRASMNVPDFTPLGRRAMPPARVRRSRDALKTPTPSFRLPDPISTGVPFQTLDHRTVEKSPRKVPPLLFAPRYSHLLEEAQAVSRGVASRAVAEQEQGQEQEQEKLTTEEPVDASVDESVDESLDQSVIDSSIDRSADDSREETFPHTPAFKQPDVPAPAPRTSVGGRVKGFLFSYLPTMNKTAPVPKRSIPFLAKNQLPLPPLELLEKTRGPITTPVREPVPKQKHPKELVDLFHIQIKPKSMIPKRIPPKRLVELNHVSPEKPIEPVRVRPRTSSGGSVKDLVKGFEAMDKVKKAIAGGELRRVKSFNDPRSRFQTEARPKWRP